MSLSLWWYVDDDAGISFTYARNLSNGNGLIFNVGDPPVEGYSNPAWVLVLAGFHSLGLDILQTAKVLGIMFGAVSLILIWGVVKEWSPWSWLALPLTATNCAFVVWNNSGLETSLHALLLTVLVVLLLNPRGNWTCSVLLCTVLSLLVLTRPEGVLFCIGSAAYYFLKDRPSIDGGLGRARPYCHIAGPDWIQILLLRGRATKYLLR